MKRGILKVIGINLMCVSLLFLSAFFDFSPKKSFSYNIKGETGENVNTEPANNEEKNENSSPEKVQEEEKENESKTESSEKTTTQVSASAIKGNIISQYNSPYTAKDSFDGVYLKNNTSLNISIKRYLQGNINFKIAKNDQPQVLILHTHATETFKTDDNPYYTEDFTSRSRDNAVNMISVGKIVSDKLNAAGITTLHDTTLHDYPSYSKSYSRSAETVKSYLKKYPSIKVVLDLHRDAVTKENGDKVKLVTEINGKTAAQVMLVQGSQSGGITNFPNWEENFKLAVKLQQVMEKKYPTLARPLMLRSKNYNQSLSTGALLIEFGTDANTLSEVHYSAELVGDSLAELLSSLQ